MPDDKVLQDVRSWLSQHGYVLEMEVARELIPHCSYVAQGEQYVDPVTGKLREIDIFCSWGGAKDKIGVHHSVEMVIECKNTTAPWVAFFGGSPSVEGGILPNLVDGKEWMDCIRCDEIQTPLFDLAHAAGASIAYAITEKKNEKGGKDLAREAVLSVTSASIAHVHAAEEFREASPVHYSLNVLPLVVTKSPLVACSLSESGDVNLSHIDRCRVFSTHEKWDSLPIGVFVINIEVFRRFVTEIASMCRRAGLK
jgi:hypothetical protein